MLLALLAKPVEAKEIARQDFIDWKQAVWFWENLKTKEDFSNAWEKIDKPFSEWEELYQANPSKARQQLKTHPQAALIKQGHDLKLVYLWWAKKAKNNATGFWEVYEPNCYEGGEIFGFFADKTNYKRTDEWAKMNIFTGKCDWPDWRTKEAKAGSADWKADYLGKLEHRK